MLKMRKKCHFKEVNKNFLTATDGRTIVTLLKDELK